MKIYKRLQPFKVISFDLDDTLYDNLPIIKNAEMAQRTFLNQHCPEAQHVERSYWLSLRKQLLTQQPALQHDIGKLRLHVLELGIKQLGYSTCAAQDISEAAFSAFLTARNQITISPQVVALLNALKNKYKLIAITNGNANIHQIGLSQQFEFALAAGQKRSDNRELMKMKPSTDMFDYASSTLAINKQDILHIGDSLSSDVNGALRSGCQAIWLNEKSTAITNAKLLPHLEMTQLNQLQHLL